MNVRKTTRVTCLLLMAALVHQLGAAPCGCLEHNGWRQAMVALLHPGEAPGHDAGTDGVHELECEHQPAQLALVPTRNEAFARTGGVQATGPTPGEVPSAAALSVEATNSRRAATRPRLPVRAQTQVFRL